MAPKRGSKRKTSTKSKPKSAPKTRKRPSQTNALLKQVLVALGGGQGPIQPPRSAPRLTRNRNFDGYGYGPSTRPYNLTEPGAFLETVNYNGRPFARMNCPAGKIADYKSNTCVEAPLYNKMCKKDYFNHPLTGDCVDELNPMLGYTFDNGRLVNVGRPFAPKDGWSYYKDRLPLVKYKPGANGMWEVDNQ